MADIELVIKITEEIVTDIRDYCGMSIADVKETLPIILNAIHNGTPLPKGHGKLIAEPTEEDIAKTVGGQNDFAECIRDAVKAVFDNADAIIEADKEDEDGNDDWRDSLAYAIETMRKYQKIQNIAENRDEKIIDNIDFAIKATDSQDDYGMGMRNGMRYVKYLIDGKEPQYESKLTDEEIKLGLSLGDEVIDDFGVKGVVVGIDTYGGDLVLSLLMRNHKVPQLVKASGYKTKTGRHFPQIIEVLEQIKGEADEK